MVSGQEDQSDIKIFIRGVGTNNPTETGDQGVGVYVDGVYAARHRVPWHLCTILKMFRYCVGLRVLIRSK